MSFDGCIRIVSVMRPQKDAYSPPELHDSWWQHVESQEYIVSVYLNAIGQQYRILEVVSQSLRVDFNSCPCRLSSKGLNRVTRHNHHLSGSDFTCQVLQQSQNSIFTPTMQRNSVFLLCSEACFTSSDNVVFKSRNKILRRHEGSPWRHHAS